MLDTKLFVLTTALQYFLASIFWCKFSSNQKLWFMCCKVNRTTVVNKHNLKKHKTINRHWVQQNTSFCCKYNANWNKQGPFHNRKQSASSYILIEAYACQSWSASSLTLILYDLNTHISVPYHVLLITHACVSQLSPRHECQYNLFSILGNWGINNVVILPKSGKAWVIADISLF